MGCDASPLPDDYDALKQGAVVQTRMSGKPFDYAFAPAVDYYLKAHLFGDIFARDGCGLLTDNCVPSRRCLSKKWDVWRLSVRRKLWRRSFVRCLLKVDQ